MSVKVKGILTELKNRLDSTGYAVHVGKEFSDAETDALPMVSIFFADKGEASDEGDLNQIAFDLQKQTLHLIVECHARVSPDQPLMDLEDIHTKVKAALFSPAGGRVGDGIRIVLSRRRSWPHSQFDTVAFFQIELRIPYREDY